MRCRRPAGHYTSSSDIPRNCSKTGQKCPCLPRLGTIATPALDWGATAWQRTYLMRPKGRRRTIMRVKDVMTAGVECVHPGDTLHQAASRMRELNIGALPVCGNQDRLVGMITDRDIAVRAVADGCGPDETKVSDCMTPEIVYCFEDQDVSEAANLMEERQIRRVAVLNQNKRLVGIVSLGDLAVKGDGHLSCEALERVSEPAAPAR